MRRSDVSSCGVERRAAGTRARRAPPCGRRTTCRRRARRAAPRARSSVSNGRGCALRAEEDREVAGRALLEPSSRAISARPSARPRRSRPARACSIATGSPRPRAERSVFSWRVGLWRDHAVGGVEDRLRRAVVRLEPDDLGAGEVALEAEDLASRRRRASRRSTGRRRPRRTGCGGAPPSAARSRTAARSCPGTRRPARSGSASGSCARSRSCSRSRRTVRSSRSSKSSARVRASGSS